MSDLRVPMPGWTPRGAVLAVPFIRGWQLAVVDRWPRGGATVRVVKWVERHQCWMGPVAVKPEVCIDLEVRVNNWPAAPPYPSPGKVSRERIRMVRQANRELAAEEAQS